MILKIKNPVNPQGLEHNQYMDTSIEHAWYFYKIGLFRYDPNTWFVYGAIKKTEIDINECKSFLGLDFILNLSSYEILILCQLHITHYTMFR